MARYTGADCKRCRREKMQVFRKGSKGQSRNWTGGSVMTKYGAHLQCIARCL